MNNNDTPKTNAECTKTEKKDIKTPRASGFTRTNNVMQRNNQTSKHK